MLMNACAAMTVMKMPIVKIHREAINAHVKVAILEMAHHALVNVFSYVGQSMSNLGTPNPN